MRIEKFEETDTNRGLALPLSPGPSSGSGEWNGAYKDTVSWFNP